MPLDFKPSRSVAWRAAVLLLSATGALTIMDALAKSMLEGSLHVMQLLALRSLLIGSLLYLVYRARGRQHELRPVNRRAQYLRAATGCLAPVCFFTGLTYLPLTDATVVSYSAVFFIVILSSLALKERIGPVRWSAVVFGYLGVIVAMRPEGSFDLRGYGLILLASIAYASFTVSGKWLTRSETAISLVHVYNLAVGLFALLWLPWVWQAMNAMDLWRLALFGLLAVVGQFGLISAYRQADASLLAPLEYTSLLWAIGLDVLIWQSYPDSRVLVGALMIIAASLYVLHRERRQQRRL